MLLTEKNTVSEGVNADAHKGANTRRALFELLEEWSEKNTVGEPTGVELCDQIVGMLESLLVDGGAANNPMLDLIYQVGSELLGLIGMMRNMRHCGTLHDQSSVGG